MLTEGRSPIPIVQAYVYPSDSAADGAVAESDVPARVANPYRGAGDEEAAGSTRAGCLTVVALVGVVLHLAIWLLS